MFRWSRLLTTRSGVGSQAAGDWRRRGSIVWLGVVVLLGLLVIPESARGGVDGDGNLDVVFATVDQSDSRVCLGDGSGGFTCVDVFIPAGNGARSVAIGDVDNDGDPDLVFGVVGDRNQVCLGDGSGGFACADVSIEGNGTLGVAVGDVNGDGDLDAVFAEGGFLETVCLGDGSGGFGCSEINATSFDRTSDVALGDVDGDGHLDAVFANEGHRNRVCLGNGSGDFACSDVSTLARQSIDVALGDLNGDGDLDSVFAGHGGRNTACLGDGAGGFTCSDVSSDAFGSFGVALGDVNGDGDVDAVFANSDDRNRVCLGDGSGGFGCRNVSNDTNSTWDVGIGDVDRDGHLDAVFANFGEPNQRDRVCMGDGSGGFTCGDVSSDALDSHNLALMPGHRGTFFDDDFSNFESDIEWIAGEGITKGCNPPVNDRYCPDDLVTRGQMAAFLVRALGYTDDGGGDLFVDDDGTTFEKDIDRLGTAGVTRGCNPPINDRYCPDDFVTRGQMAAFLVRALGYTDDGGGDLFIDDDGTTFESDIDKLGTAGVTKGCNPPVNDRYCPDDFVTRGQMAAFLRRALS